MARWMRCPRDGYIWSTASVLKKVPCPSCYYKMDIEANTITEEEAKIALSMEHFNIDENGVKILDKTLTTNNSPRGTIIDVFFKRGKAWCEYDDSDNCKHIEYALSLPVVIEIFKQKGWKT